MLFAKAKTTRPGGYEGRKDTTMNFINIESIMTAKVAEYIAKGYTLSTGTMSGSQGEVAKVDVVKNKQVVRIMLTRENRYDDNGCYFALTLTVGCHTLPKARCFDRIIWNRDLEVIERREFFSVDIDADNFTENRDDLIEQHKKQMQRWRNREALREMRIKKDITSEKAKAIVLPFIRRQNRCKRMKVEDIVKVIRFNTSKYDKMHYNVTLSNGKTYKLA